MLILAMGVTVASRGRWWAIVLTTVGNPVSAMVIWGGVPFDSAPLFQAWLPVARDGRYWLPDARTGTPRERTLGF